MKHIKNYEVNKFKPKTNTFWFISGDSDESIKVLKELKYHLKIDNILELDLLLDNVKHYLNYNCIGFFIYYSKYGFSYSIIKDMNEMMEVYKVQTSSNIYKFIGELKINNDNVYFDNSIRILIEDLIKYNV